MKVRDVLTKKNFVEYLNKIKKRSGKKTICGVSGTISSCPIAIYLKKITKYDFNILDNDSINDKGQDYYYDYYYFNGDKIIRGKLPLWVNNFIYNLDNAERVIERDISVEEALRVLNTKYDNKILSW